MTERSFEIVLAQRATNVWASSALSLPGIRLSRVVDPGGSSLPYALRDDATVTATSSASTLVARVELLEVLVTQSVVDQAKLDLDRQRLAAEERAGRRNAVVWACNRGSFCPRHCQRCDDDPRRRGKVSGASTKSLSGSGRMPRKPERPDHIVTSKRADTRKSAGSSLAFDRFVPGPAQRRHLRFVGLTALAILLSAFPVPQMPAVAEGNNPGIIVYICDSANAPSRPWRQTLSRAILDSLANSDGAHVSVRGEAQCGPVNVEVACIAGVYDKVGSIITCAPGTLIDLIEVAAWFAIEHTTAKDEDYEAFRLRHAPRLGLAAFASVHEAQAGSPIAAKIEALREQLEDGNGAAVSTRTQLIFQAIVDLVFAALIGHESGHLETQPPYCAIGTASRAEESGLWGAMLRTAGSGELYQQQSPDLGEIRADRCATRRIRAARIALEKTELPVADQAFVLRAAADIVSTILLVRFDEDGAPPALLMNSDYLYPPLRIAALAGELGLGPSGTVICGGAAENLTQSIQYTYKKHPGGGALPQEIEDLLPNGVIDAWEGRVGWSAASFACD